jgi:hypothetical protein
MQESGTYSLLEFWWAEITFFTHESFIQETLLVVGLDRWDDNSLMG